MISSTLEQFAICHQAEFTQGIASFTALPTYPSLPLDIKNNKVSIVANRTVTGHFREILKARQLSMTFNLENMTKTEALQLGQLIDDKETLYKSRMFYFNFYYPLKGWVYSLFYTGTPIEIKQMGSIDNGRVSVSFDVIEVDGVQYS